MSSTVNRYPLFINNSLIIYVPHIYNISRLCEPCCEFLSTGVEKMIYRKLYIYKASRMYRFYYDLLSEVCE